jgi:hypothetical protein
VAVCVLADTSKAIPSVLGIGQHKLATHAQEGWLFHVHEVQLNVVLRDVLPLAVDADNNIWRARRRYVGNLQRLHGDRVSDCRPKQRQLLGRERAGVLLLSQRQ